MTAELPTLSEPADGVPEVITSPEALQAYDDLLIAGSGPVAVDAERASGFRYGHRAYLIQLRRAGAGTALIDPTALPDLHHLAAALQGTEWILHSATQDLPCLADEGLRPSRLFDTELAARMLNLPRAGLANLTAALLGLHLAKGHSAADWSTRPLPPSWLRYAALDVEVLIALRDILDERLVEAGKREWAAQEFEHLTTWAPTPKSDPWRRTAGLGGIRDRRQLEIVRRLWLARDATARERDRAPGRVLHDDAIVAIVKAVPTTPAELLAVPTGRRSRTLTQWWPAVAEALAADAGDLPPLRAVSDDPPPTRVWKDKDPAAADRFAAARAVVLAEAERLDMPAEILISPDIVRRWTWRPGGADVDGVGQFLAARGARPWQVEHLAPLLAATLEP